MPRQRRSYLRESTARFTSASYPLNSSGCISRAPREKNRPPKTCPHLVTVLCDESPKKREEVGRAEFAAHIPGRRTCDDTKRASKRPNCSASTTYPSDGKGGKMQVCQKDARAQLCRMQVPVQSIDNTGLWSWCKGPT